jgi:transcription elongation GreA/GreB family factor
VLEDLAPTELLADEIAVATEFAQRLLGRKVGDAVAGHIGELAAHHGTIIAIEHK